MGRYNNNDNNLDMLLSQLNKKAAYETHDDGFVNAEVAYSSFGDADDVLHFYGYSEKPVLGNRSSVIIKVEVCAIQKIRESLIIRYFTYLKAFRNDIF